MKAVQRTLAAWPSLKDDDLARLTRHLNLLFFLSSLSPLESVCAASSCSAPSVPSGRSAMIPGLHAADSRKPCWSHRCVEGIHMKVAWFHVYHSAACAKLILALISMVQCVCAKQARQCGGWRAIGCLRGKRALVPLKIQRTAHDVSPRAYRLHPQNASIRFPRNACSCNMSQLGCLAPS